MNEGRKALTLEEQGKLGGPYNNFMQTSLPGKFRAYNPAEETVDSAHVAFTTAFPRGFALEVLQVYSGPPVIVYKFRHWAYMEGPFKGHAPTGELVELYGIGIFEVSLWLYFYSSSSSLSICNNNSIFLAKQVDEHMKIVKVEFFLDRGELLGGLMKGASLDGSITDAASSCPVLRGTG